MAVKKHKLKVAIEEDFCLLGIVSDEPDYKLCWLINQSLGMHLVKQDEIILYHKKTEKQQEFTVFAYTDEEALLTYRIIKNRAEQGYFLDELKNLDYLVHIQGEINPGKIATFLAGTSAMAEVRMSVPVNLKTIRNKERLFLW